MNRREYWERRIGPGEKLTPRRMASVLECSPRTIQRQVKAGALRALGGGGCDMRRIVVLRQDFIEFLLRQERQPAS